MYKRGWFFNHPLFFYSYCSKFAANLKNEFFIYATINHHDLYYTKEKVAKRSSATLNKHEDIKREYKMKIYF